MYVRNLATTLGCVEENIQLFPDFRRRQNRSEPEEKILLSFLKNKVELINGHSRVDGDNALIMIYPALNYVMVKMLHDSTQVDSLVVVSLMLDNFC